MPKGVRKGKEKVGAAGGTQRSRREAAVEVTSVERRSSRAKAEEPELTAADAAKELLPRDAKAWAEAEKETVKMAADAGQTSGATQPARSAALMRISIEGCRVLGVGSSVVLMHGPWSCSWDVARRVVTLQRIRGPGEAEGVLTNRRKRQR